MKHMKRGYWIGKIIIIGLAAITLFGFGLMYLWNWLVPDLFHGPVIGFWQALGLLVLSKVLFSGFGGKSGHRSPGWRSHWKEKWQTMNPEERERFRQKMRDKWCYRPEPEKSADENSSANV